MAPRAKNKLARLLSFNQHRKRFGAKKLLFPSKDYESLRIQVVSDVKTDVVLGSQKSLEGHLQDLRGEFSGQSELNYYHAQLSVLIRREYQVAKTYGQFLDLWTHEAHSLCQSLNLRWLVSAADTFAEHGRTLEHSSAGMLASVLINTIKIYETERVITATESCTPKDELIEKIQSQMVPLFGGMSCFTIGTDDTLRNMRWRLEPFFDHGPPGAILKTIFDRLQVSDSAYARLRHRHKRKKTSWWDE